MDPRAAKKRKLLPDNSGESLCSSSDDVVLANDAISITIARRGRTGGLLPAVSAFPPQYSHQVYAGEQITGYRDLEINVMYTHASCRAFVSSSWSNLADCDPLSPLERSPALPPSEAYTRDSTEFAQWCAEDEHFVPPGNHVATFTARAGDGDDDSDGGGGGGADGSCAT